MTDKVTLVPVSSFVNDTTAVSTVNNNMVAITTAMDNTLSRDGTSPNMMNATLDMNSNQIINLPAPSSTTSPVRLIDVAGNPNIVIPGTGTSGHVVPFLDGNNTWSGTNTFPNNSFPNSELAQMSANTIKGNNTSGTANAADLTVAQTNTLLGTITLSGNNTFTGNQYFKSGRPWADVRAYGCVGDGTTNDTTNFQAAITAVSVLGGGIVYAPPGNYSVPGGLTVPDNVIVRGAGRNATTVQAWHTDVVVFTVSGNRPGIEDLAIFAKGTNVDTGTFGATQNAVSVSSIDGTFKNLIVWGGNIPLFITGSDNYFENVFPSIPYGAAQISSSGDGGNWFHRCKIDSVLPTGSTSSTLPYSAWSATTSYTAGQCVTLSGNVIQCTTSGTSSSSPPALKNSGINMSDGTAVWQWFSASGASAILITNSGENHYTMCDFSVSGLSNSVVFNNASGLGITFISNGVLSSPIAVNTGSGVFSLESCELAAPITITSGYSGTTQIKGCFCVSGTTCPITVGANVNNVIITNNYLRSSAITVTTGTSDHYIITNNVATTVTDGGSGTHKVVTGNVT